MRKAHSLQAGFPVPNDCKHILKLDHDNSLPLKLNTLSNSLIGFDIPLTLVRIVTIFIGGFFYARSFSSLYGGLDGRASARRFLGSGMSIPFNPPPEFDISDGRNNYQGAFQ